MHLTLAFAGDATDAIGAAIVESMSLEIAQAPFELGVRGRRTFRREVRRESCGLGRDRRR